MAKFRSGPIQGDPTGWSSKWRGSENGEITVGGSEEVKMTGFQPGLTVGGEPDGGLSVGVRSGRSVSHSPTKEPCNATTYYGRMLHDGDMEFFKELKHPDGESRERYGI